MFARGLGLAAGAAVPLVLALASAGGAESTPAPAPSAAPSAAPSTEPIQVQLDGKGPQRGLAVALSEPEVVDAGVVVLSIKLGSKDRKIASISGSLGDNEFPVFPVGEGEYQAVLGVPLDTKPGTAVARLHWREDGESRSQEIPFSVKAGPYKDEVISVEPKKVDPPKSALPRIMREMKRIGEAYRRKTERKLWAGPFKMPVNSEPTSAFGTRRVYNGVKKSPHWGLDLRAKTGTPVKAPAGGVVAFAQDTYFGGNTVILDHGYGVFTSYAHLSKIQVKVGQEVETGEKLGLSGATGRVTGPHLHWGAQLSGVKINPQHLTRVMR